MPTGEQGGSAPQPIAPAKFWLKSALVIVVVGILLAWAWTPSRHEEPVYQGKSISEWLKLYYKSDDGSEAEKQAKAAIRNIGTNGFPTLLRLMQTPDSDFRTKLKALMREQTFIECNFQDAEDIRYMALYGFIFFGEDAKGAVPDLLTLVTRGSGTVGRQEAIDALGAIGPSAQAAVPALLAIASVAKDPNRGDAIHSLGSIRSSAESVVPVLENCLHDSDRGIRRTTVKVFIEFGEAAKSSAPALIPLLSDPDRQVREATTNALKRIDREAATKAGIP